MYTVKDNGRSVHHVVLELQFVWVLSMIRFVGDLILHAGTFCLLSRKIPIFKIFKVQKDNIKMNFCKYLVILKLKDNPCEIIKVFLALDGASALHFDVAECEYPTCRM